MIGTVKLLCRVLSIPKSKSELCDIHPLVQEHKDAETEPEISVSPPRMTTNEWLINNLSPPSLHVQDQESSFDAINDDADGVECPSFGKPLPQAWHENS